MENFRFSAVAKAWEHKPVEVKPMNVSVPTFFGRQVFTRERMRDYIAEQTLEQLFDAIDNNKPIGRELAGSVAIGMKKWAMDRFRPISLISISPRTGWHILLRNLKLLATRLQEFKLFTEKASPKITKRVLLMRINTDG